MAYEEAYKEVVAFIPDTTILSVGVAGTGGSAEAVPADHQRFVYFRRFWNLGGESIVSVYESRAGILVRKDMIRLTAHATWPDADITHPEVPVMSFRSSSFIRVQLSGGAGTTSGIGITFLVVDKLAGAV